MRSRHACSWLILQGLKRRREKKQLSSFWNRVQIRAGVFLTVITGLTCHMSDFHATMLSVHSHCPTRARHRTHGV